MGQAPAATSANRPSRGGVGVVVAFFVSGCSTVTSTGWSTISPASDFARAIFDLYATVSWWTIIIFVVVELLLLYTLVRYRKRPGDSQVPDQVHGFTALEIGWTMLPAAILFFIAIPTVRGIFQLQADAPPNDPLEVVVIGHQWWWEFEYPDLGVTTANELRIPVGRTVDLTLTSADVIHSFWVPRLGGKRDLNPGGENRLWFTPDSIGVYRGQCAELCGTSHANMRLTAIVESGPDFESWVQAERRDAVVDSAGMQMFLASGCAACHAIRGTVAQGRIGPDLTRFGSRTTLAAGILPNDDESLAAWLREPERVKPGSKMPNLNLSEERIEALVRFLRGLQ